MALAEFSATAIRYELSGHGDRTLILLHELGGSLESFDDATSLLALEFRVLRYDQRGAGLSEKPRQLLDYKDHAADLANLVDYLHIDGLLFVAGVAAGAALAVEFALARPDRIAALALCAPALSVPSERREYLIERSERATQGGMRAVAEMTLARSYPEFLRNDQARFAGYRARFLGNDPVCYASANVALARTRVQDSLSLLKAPCLVVAGRHDLLRPPDDVHQLARTIPNAEFDILESGHLMSVQAPGLFAERLRTFFTAHGGAARKLGAG